MKLNKDDFFFSLLGAEARHSFTNYIYHEN